MRASELGHVSCNKRQRATTSNDTIAADRDERKRRRSQQEVPKPRMTNTLDATRPWQQTAPLSRKAASPTNATRKSWGRHEYHDERRDSSRDDDYCHSGVIAATPVPRNKQEALPRQEDSSRSGKYMPLISYDASVGIKKKSKTSSKNNRSRRDTWNARHACNTRSTNSASESAGSVRDTVPNKTKQARGTTTAHTILVDSTQKNECGLWCCLALALAQEQSHKMFGEKIGQWFWLGWCVQRCYLANFETASDADLKNGIQVEKTRAKYILAEILGKYNSTGFKTHSTTSWEY